MRARIAASAAPSEMAGSTRCAGVPRPDTGSHPSSMANTIASSGPSQKFGTETPASASAVAPRVDGGAAPHRGGDAERQRDQRAPRASPRPRARRSRGCAEATCETTGSPVRSDVPRSPRTSSGQKRDVLLEQRAVEPEPAAELLHVGLRGGFAQHRLRRVAGNEVNQREDQRRDAEQHGNREHEAPRQVTKHSQDFTSARGCRRARRAAPSVSTGPDG